MTLTPSSRTSLMTSRRSPLPSASGWSGSKIPPYTQRPMCSTKEPNRRGGTGAMVNAGSRVTEQMINKISLSVQSGGGDALDEKPLEEEEGDREGGQRDGTPVMSPA